MSLHDGQPFPHFQQVKLVETMCLLLHVVTVNQRMKSATGTQEPLTEQSLEFNSARLNLLKMQGSRCDLPFFLLLLLLSHPFFPPYLNENIYKGVTDTFFFFLGNGQMLQWGPTAHR